ncbi:RNA cytidine acetyltransferase [Geodia barretti]|nr:RNA cytidine acetyltransferase [Geodia barretti]
MGYGSRALSLLHDYFSGKLAPLAEAPAVESATASTTTEVEVSLLKETIAPRTNLPPLLCRLEDRPPETLDYIGVSYGLTLQLYRFWSRLGYVPVYLRQTPNDLTGEHSCIMLRPFTAEHMWLTEYNTDFRKRFLALLSYQFRKFPPALALTLSRSPSSGKGELSLEKMETLFSPHDLKRLELYSRNMADHHLITDLLPALAQIQFSESVLHLSAAQSAILLGLGLQHKTVDDLQKELDLPASQVLGLFNRVIRKFVQVFNSLSEAAVEETLPPAAADRGDMKPVAVGLGRELREAADEFETKQNRGEQSCRRWTSPAM